MDPAEEAFAPAHIIINSIGSALEQYSIWDTEGKS